MSSRPALFLDRDGVINHDTGYLYQIGDFRFRDGIFQLCASAKARGMAIVVVTNQAGIGRGLFTEIDFHRLNDWMLAQFRERGIAIDAVEYCPFHPVHGVPPYRAESQRRKPGPGMILDAAKALGLDLGMSVMIGDHATDMLAAKAAGVGSYILLAATACEAAAAPSGTIVLGDGSINQAQHIIEGLSL